jgi:hypothetical protein
MNLWKIITKNKYIFLKFKLITLFMILEASLVIDL